MSGGTEFKRLDGSNIQAFLNDFVINDVTLVSKFLFVDSLRVFSDSRGVSILSEEADSRPSFPHLG